MEEQIREFAKQFSFEPEVLHLENLPENPSSFVVCGMGGSHLGADLLLSHDPSLPLSVWSDYGVPRTREGALIIASSYSGETEETLDAARSAAEAGFSVTAITTGGTLANLARERGWPLVLLSKEDAEPRMMVGAFMLALARLIQLPELEQEIRDAGKKSSPERGLKHAEEIAAAVKDSVPLIYASTKNAALASYWKIAFNETAKVAAFCNVIPEACHNELSGFDSHASSLHPLFLSDPSDHPRIQKRMQLMQELLNERGVKTLNVELIGDGLTKIFDSVLLALSSSVVLARSYGETSAATPLISEFKRRMTL